MANNYRHGDVIILESCIPRQSSEIARDKVVLAYEMEKSPGLIMNKIETLTKKQIEIMPKYVDEWIKIGLATEKEGFDKKIPEAAIKKAYECAGLKHPEVFIWTESPLHSGICYSLFKNVKTASVWASVRASVRASVWDSVWASIAGSHEVGWLSFYRYFHDEIKIDCSKLDGFWECAKNCGWFIPLANTVIVSPRPYVIKTILNDRKDHILHADGEPAVFYCDDFKIFANNGIRLPEKYGSVKIKDWKSEWLLQEKNAEIRMCLIKNIGYDKICQDLQAKKLDSWREYELLRIDNADIEPIILLKMTCPSTGKIHAARMSPDTKGAREAATKLNCGIDPSSFLIEH